MPVQVRPRAPSGFSCRATSRRWDEGPVQVLRGKALKMLEFFGMIWVWSAYDLRMAYVMTSVRFQIGPSFTDSIAT